MIKKHKDYKVNFHFHFVYMDGGKKRINIEKDLNYKWFLIILVFTNLLDKNHISGLEIEFIKNRFLII